MYTKIAIVFPTKDRPNTLHRFFTTLSQTNHNANVYCMADASGTLDENIDIVSHHATESGKNYICIPHNFPGVHQPCNLGIELARNDGCDVIITTDDDTIWVEPHPQIKFNLADEAYSDLPESSIESALLAFNAANWEMYLLDELNSNSKSRAVFFCKPFRSSAFAFGVDILDELESLGRQLFDPNYISGHWGDNDCYLELYTLATNHPKNLVREHIAIIRNWITHQHSGEGSQWPSGDANPNLKYFRQKWVKVDPEHPLSREMKNNEVYYALRSELEKYGYSNS